MPVNMNLHVSGNVDSKVVGRLKDCNINWVTNSSIPAAGAYIIFSGQGDKKSISYYVLDKNGNFVVPKQSFGWKKADEAGVSLAYRLFGIGDAPLPDRKSAN